MINRGNLKFRKIFLWILALAFFGLLGGCKRGWGFFAIRSSCVTGGTSIPYWYCCVHNIDKPNEKLAVFLLDLPVDIPVTLKVDFENGRCVLGKKPLVFPKGKNVALIGLDGKAVYLTLKDNVFCRKWGHCEVFPREERIPGQDIKHPGPVIFRGDDKLLIDFKEAMKDKTFKKAWMEFIGSAKKQRKKNK